MIDLAEARSAAGRGRVASAIDTACRSSGFFTVVGHGVGLDLIARMDAVCREFFALPASEKARVAVTAGTHGLYAHAGSAARSIGREAPPDLNEVFIVGARGDDPAQKRALLGDPNTPWAAVNRWPASPATFRAVWQEYVDVVGLLAADLIRLCALALGLDEDFFADKIDNHMSTIAANYYFPTAAPPLPGQLRKGPHTDWGNLTILYQDPCGGLEVQRAGHGWLDVPYTPGGFVINIGDLLAFWTAGRWVSTMHRVRNPVEGHTESRISIPYFHMPNHDARIEPLFAFSDAATEARFQSATTPGEWYRERLAATISGS